MAFDFNSYYIIVRMRDNFIFFAKRKQPFNPTGIRTFKLSKIALACFPVLFHESIVKNLSMYVSQVK